MRFSVHTVVQFDARHETHVRRDRRSTILTLQHHHPKRGHGHRQDHSTRGGEARPPSSGRSRRESPKANASPPLAVRDVDKLVDSVGLIPPSFIETGFDLLRPAGRAASAVRLWDNLWNDEYVRSCRMIARWGAETLPLAGEYFR